jgi:hypothetical protein
MRFISAPRGRWRWVVAAGVATAIGLTSAGQVWAAPKAAPAFSAVDLADAVLFDGGPAAPYLAELDREKVEPTEASHHIQQVIDKAIEADPKWGSSFAVRIQSGNPRLVQSAVQDLWLFSRTALEGVYGTDAVAKSILEAQKAADNGTGTNKWIVLTKYVFLYKYVAVVKHVAIANNPVPTNPNPQPVLVDELTVRAIAQGLSVTATE